MSWRAGLVLFVGMVLTTGQPISVAPDIAVYPRPQEQPSSPPSEPTDTRSHLSGKRTSAFTAETAGLHGCVQARG